MTNNILNNEQKLNLQKMKKESLCNLILIEKKMQKIF